jgi:hypothetical protein
MQARIFFKQNRHTSQTFKAFEQLEGKTAQNNNSPAPSQSTPLESFRNTRYRSLSPEETNNAYQWAKKIAKPLTILSAGVFCALWLRELNVTQALTKLDAPTKELIQQTIKETHSKIKPGFFVALCLAAPLALMDQFRDLAFGFKALQTYFSKKHPRD